MKEKMNVRTIYKKILALLVTPLIITGCSKQEECDIKVNHVHKYIKDTDNGRIVTLIDSHDTNYNDYRWTDDYVEINDENKDFYKSKKTLFKGEDNWDYLYNLMTNNKDYIEYHYDYHKKRVVTTSGKQTLTYPVMQRHAGYTTDPNHEGLDGEIKLHHYQYYGYKISYKDGKYIKEKSPLVDDIREIINDYPYFELDCYRVITKDINVDKSILPSIKIEDVNDFPQPDLTNKELNINTK